MLSPTLPSKQRAPFVAGPFRAHMLLACIFLATCNDDIYVHVFGDLKWEVWVGPPSFCVEIFVPPCPPWMNVLRQSFHAERFAMKSYAPKQLYILLCVALGPKPWPTWATRNPHVLKKRVSALVNESAYTSLCIMDGECTSSIRNAREIRQQKSSPNPQTL